MSESKQCENWSDWSVREKRILARHGDILKASENKLVALETARLSKKEAKDAVITLVGRLWHTAEHLGRLGKALEVALDEED